jgi:hypothetical protein
MVLVIDAERSRGDSMAVGVAAGRVSRWLRGRVALAVVAAVAFSLGTSMGPFDWAPRAVATNPADTSSRATERVSRS